ncbi:MAG: hypothetical protein J6X55_13220 [Victivallales bacterium]|nr:hypothetical protein [Victivallales bacterium]
MKIKQAVNLSRVVVVIMCLFMVGMMSYAAESVAEAAPADAIAEAVQNPSAATDAGFKYLGIAVIMACGSFAASLAVGKIGAAAMGAAAEKPELLGKAIAFVGLGEGIALFGFLISLMMLNK